MKLNQIYEIVRKIDYKKLQLKHDYNSQIWNNIINFKIFIDIINELIMFETEIQHLFKSPLYKTTLDSLQAPNAIIFTEINTIAIYLVDACEALSRTLGSIVKESKENSITIKFADPKDLEEFLKILTDLNTAISQSIINSKINGSVKLQNIEFGSIWLEILLGTPAALTLVAGIVWSAAVIYKKIQEGRIFKEYVQSLKIKNESLRDIEENQEQLSKILLDKESNHLLLENFNTDQDFETLERIKLSIKLFVGLIQKGAEIHPALNSPESVKNLFPDFKKLNVIESKIKELTEGK
jgi:hypothetical protein